MKILFAHHIFSHFGGGEKILLDEMTLLQESSHSVYVFSTDKQPFMIDNYEYANYFTRYVDFQALSKVEKAKNFFKTIYNLDAKHKFSLFIDKIKPDVVHCHNIFYYLTPSIIDVCNERNIPVVMTLHDTRLVCPAATLRIKDQEYCKKELCVRGNAFNCIKYKCKYKSFVASTLVVADYYFRKLTQFSSKISKFICPSDALARLVIKSGIGEDKVVVLNNFVEESFFDIEPDYSNQGYFLYVGRLLNVKGLDILLKAMSLNPQFQLRIVGSGPEEKQLKNLASDLNLKNVLFVGYKTGKELALEFSGSISTILPSNWFENYPVSVIESFCYGKPLIGSNIGGIPELINNNENGIVFEIGNIEELSNALNKLWLSPDLSIQLGKNARDYAENRFRKNYHYTKLNKIYTSVIR